MRTPSPSRRAVVCAAAVAITAVARPAHALFDAGAQAGIVGRSASAPIGLGFGWHGDLDLVPLVKVGAYVLHYDLSAKDRPDPLAADASFNAVGLRTIVRVPIAGRLRSHAFVGLGYTFAHYAAPVGRSGRFWEIPVGAGIGYEAIDRVELSLDGAFRPGVAFGGQAFGDDSPIARPVAGWSLMLGATVDL